MNAVKFNYDEHAKMVGKWLEKHAFPLPPRFILPDIGFMVNNAACGFLYTTNSRLGWIEWVFGNPESTKDERAFALDTVFKLLEATAKTLGVVTLFSSATVASYQAVLERNRFEKTDKNVTHYVKVLEEI